MSSISFQNVCLKAPAENGSNAAQRRPWILRDVDLEIPARTIYTILGPSGSGKTSLLRLINRLNDPTSGEIVFAGRPLPSYDPTQLRRRIGYIFQVPAMLPGTVADNLAYGACHGHSNRRRPCDPGDMVPRLKQVALDETYLDQPADRLSVGEQQRASIARSLMTSPEVLLMDEPTSSLDPAATSRLLDLIVDLHQRNNLTIVFVTHQLEQARAVGRQTAILIDGRIIETGTTEAVFASPREEATRRFLDGRLGEGAEAKILEAST